MFETQNRTGKKYLFKPAESKQKTTEFFRADIQAAAYKLQKKLNPKGAIPCFTKIIDNMYGAVQEKIETRDDFNIFKWQKNGGNIPLNILEGILEEYVVDWAICNFDTHGRNFIIDNNGNVRGCDKEQAFRYLLKKESVTPNLDYNPNSVYGETEPIYNTIFKRFINGELENVNFEMIRELLRKSIRRLNAISDEEYLGYFRSYIEKLPIVNKSEYFDEVLKRKHDTELNIENFLSYILQKRKEKELSQQGVGETEGER